MGHGFYAVGSHFLEEKRVESREDWGVMVNSPFEEEKSVW